MRGRYAGALLTAILTCLAARPADACSCMAVGPACQAYWSSDAVFEATVRSIGRVERREAVGDREIRLNDTLVTLDVHQSWKGVEAGPLEVTTSEHGAACGFAFKEGGRYLVFAHSGGPGGRLRVSTCSRTQELQGANATVAFLTSLGEPARGGRVFGTVRTAARAFAFSQPSGEAATETVVRLFGDGQERTTTSSGGRYEFSGLAAGPYRLELLLPAGHATYATTRNVQIPDPRACAEENYSLSPAGRIGGRLVGKDQRGLARVRVEVTDPAARVHPIYGLDVAAATTDDDGHFEVTGLAPGPYLVGVNLKDLVSEYNPYARTVFTGGGLEPQVLTLSLGQVVDIGAWEIPPPLAVVRVEGTVTWADGTPAAGIFVSAADRTGNPVDRARGAGGATAGPDGRFVIDLRAGRLYSFVVRAGQSALLPVAGPQLQIGLAPPAPIRLTIQRNPPRP